MEVLPLIATVALIHILGAMSPGPDFIMVMRNSLVYDRRSGIYSALGLGLGILVHVAYCLLGIALIISQSVIVFSIVKYVGAAYLLYVGFKALRAKKPEQLETMTESTQQQTPLQAVKMGFITNVTNPKVTLFFLSLFTLVIQPDTPLWAKLVMGAEMSIATTLWFSLVAVLVSHRIIRKRIAKVQHYIERAMGGVLILFGLKLGSAHVK